MALLQNTASAMGNKPTSDKVTESIFTANQQLNKPTKVSGRPIEVVPKQAELDVDAAKKMVDFAKSQAVTGSVSGDSLVQTQLDKVLAANGPLMKRARENAAMATAERGLNNSSIGVQAGEEAAISSALPIAQQDAGTYANMDLTNVNAQNQFASTGVNQAFNQLNQKNDQIFSASENNKNREFQTGERESAQQFSSEQSIAADKRRLEGELTLADKTLEGNILLNDRTLEGNKALQQLDAQNQVALEDIRFENQQTLNSSQIAQTIYQNHQSAVANIMSQPGMTPSQAGAALAILNQTTKDNLQLAGALSGVDLSAFAPSGGVSGTSTTDKKGNVTNTFNTTASSGGASKQPITKEQWLNEKISVEVPGPKGSKTTRSMTRAEAITKKYITDTFSEMPFR